MFSTVWRTLKLLEVDNLQDRAQQNLRDRKSTTVIHSPTPASAIGPAFQIENEMWGYRDRSNRFGACIGWHDRQFYIDSAWPAQCR